MTSLVAWVGGHTHGQASLNIATDNRISWSVTSGGNASGIETWDHGRKVFSSRRYPIIAGYCGDVLFPVIAIPALLDRIDADGAPQDYVSPEELRRVIDSFIGRLKEGWGAYPRKATLSIYIGYREDLTVPGPGVKESPVFHLVRLCATAKSWDIQEIDLPNTSQMVACDGSGKNAIHDHIDAWNMSGSAHTSRAIYSAFVDAIVSRVDPLSGGAPQLACLYRKWPGRLLGIVHGSNAYFAGLPVTPREKMTSVEFRNDAFERVNIKGKLLPGAQRQERPTDLII